VLATGSAIKAAALALAACPDAKTAQLLGTVPDLSAAVKRGERTWEHLGQEL
jgi:hypothetical protein